MWSGGPKDGKSPETGITYPLMSEAVATGLYHPRCKDSHTTYFEGISTPPDDKFTREELDDLEEKNQREARQRYAYRQEERFGRLEKYSLDPENRKMYRQKADSWKNVAKAADSDIMESDLGAFKRRLRGDKNIKAEYYTSLKEKFSRGSRDAKAAFTKFVPTDSVEDATYENVAKFDTKTKKISMHYGADFVNERGRGTTWFHEHGHLIDDAAGKISDDEEFMHLLRKDAYNYRINYGKNHNLKTWDKVDAAISGDLNEMRKHSGVADMMEGITGGNIKGIAGHPAGYWSNEKNITAEAFAHMFEAEFDQKRYAEMKKYFPESLKYFEKQLKEVSK